MSEQRLVSLESLAAALEGVDVDPYTIFADLPVQPAGLDEPALTDQPISLEAEVADLLDVLRTAGTVDGQGDPYIPVTDAVQFAINRVQLALDDPLRSLLLGAPEPEPAAGLDAVERIRAELRTIRLRDGRVIYSAEAVNAILDAEASR